MKTLADNFPKALQANSQHLARLNKILPPLITFMLIIACAYLLSQISWSLIPGQTSENAPPSHIKTISQTNKSADYSHIVDAHLFGTFKQTAANTPPKEAPETRLNLVLKGILAVTPMEQASVIISMGKNGKEDIYGIGDKVSSATVKEIYADRVILSRSGKLETLRMPKDASDKLFTSSVSNRSIDKSSPGSVLADIRKNILRNPTSFGKYAIPVPYRENGRLRGYRLKPQGDKALFETVGLQASDVILAINGIELNNPTKGLKALRSLQSAKQVNLTILRNGSELPLQFDVP